MKFKYGRVPSYLSALFAASNSKNSYQNLQIINIFRSYIIWAPCPPNRPSRFYVTLLDSFNCCMYKNLKIAIYAPLAFYLYYLGAMLATPTVTLDVTLLCHAKMSCFYLFYHGVFLALLNFRVHAKIANDVQMAFYLTY